MSPILVIGLTGGIGAGKTTVAKLFADRGVPIIDADLIAREILLPEQPAFLKICDHFQGEKILHENGHINREKLRTIIFNDHEERLWLEKLLHPLIRKEMQQRLEKVSAPYCIMVVPLLVEAEPFTFIDRILVVDTPEHLQIERVVSRDNVSADQVEAIIKVQASRSSKMAKAHDIIINEGNLIDLERQVEKLHHQYKKGKD